MQPSTPGPDGVQPDALLASPPLRGVASNVAPTPHRFDVIAAATVTASARSRMSVFRHSVFGVSLECDFRLLDLPDSDDSVAPCWRVHTRRDPPPPWTSPAIGSEVVDGDVMVHAFSAGTDLRLAFDDTGTFDVRPAERSIVWYPGPKVTDAAVRADLLGRVIALAAHADGRLTLHASAVSVDGQGIAFLGPKHAGKSTLGLALVRCGARLLADDTVVVRFDAGGAWGAVGVQRPRLWADSIEALGVPGGASAGEKPTIDLPADQLEQVEVPLRACYILAPAATSAASPVRRHRLAPVHAAVSLVGYSKLGALLGGSEAPEVLERSATLAERVPAYRLDVARDLGRLTDVARQIRDWHGGDRAPNASADA